MAENKAMADEFKAAGNKAMSEGRLDDAIEQYTKGLEVDKENHILYSNRSAAYAKKQSYKEALNDAEEVIRIQPKWAKGYSRKGSALQFLNRFEEAKMAFEVGLQHDPNNEQLKKGLEESEDKLTGPGGSQPLGNPFGNLDAILPRLRADPRTAKYCDDPEYRMLLEMLGKDPKNLAMFLKDPRVTDTLSVLLGFDLKAPDDGESPPGPTETNKPAEPEPKVQEVPMETEEADDEESEKKKQALTEKELGNASYKKKEFEAALQHYDKAIGLDSTNVTFYTNKAAVYFEQGEHEKCRKTCFSAIDVGRDHRADYKLIAKAFARIGNSYMKEKDYAQAIKHFEKSLTEHRLKETLEKLQQCKKFIKEEERLAYIDPEKSIEEKTKGNEAFQNGKFPDAVKHYTEAIKRNPDDAKLYSNRSAAYMKLMEFSLALKDSEECINKDTTFVKGHIRKGAALEAMKQTTKAMDAYQKALDLDPNAKEASEGYFRCLNSDLQNRNDPESVRRRAMADPEVQQIMSDPAMKIILEQMQQDPKAAQDHLKNPDIMKKIQKLMDVGLISIR